jgi:hypothetical protein
MEAAHSTERFYPPVRLHSALHRKIVIWDIVISCRNVVVIRFICCVTNSSNTVIRAFVIFIYLIRILVTYIYNRMKGLSVFDC